MIRNLLVFALISPAFAQTPVIMGMGDSLGEGVQSDNAFTLSQQQGYLNDIATQANAPFALPLIKSSALGVVGSATGRSRVSLTTLPQDVAVSGATVSNVLTQVANTTPVTEADLVLAPYYGMSQIQIVEQVKPDVVFCWAGTDDLISYVLDFNSLNAPTGITPLGQFESGYQELISRLKATGAKVIVGNIPDITKIAYLFDNDDLTKYSGTNYNLPAGTVTTFEAMIEVKLGVLTPDIFTNPAYILTPQQLTHIQNRIHLFNAVIQKIADAEGFPVVDVQAIFDSLTANPVTLEGITIGQHFNQGEFSLDGVHPSDTGYAILANAFIKAADQAYALNIPPITSEGVVKIFNHDPFVDFNGNGVVPGRPDTGMLETLGPILGLSGDTTDPSAKVSAADFMRAYYSAKGLDPNTPWQNADVSAAVHEMLHPGK